MWHLCQTFHPLPQATPLQVNYLVSQVLCNSTSTSKYVVFVEMDSNMRVRLKWETCASPGIIPTKPPNGDVGFPVFVGIVVCWHVIFVLENVLAVCAAALSV